MKILYIALFIADFILMILLSFLLLGILYNHHTTFQVFVIISGISVSMALLFIIVKHFVKTPFHNDQ